MSIGTQWSWVLIPGNTVLIKITTPKSNFSCLQRGLKELSSREDFLNKPWPERMVLDAYMVGGWGEGRVHIVQNVQKYRKIQQDCANDKLDGVGDIIPGISSHGEQSGVGPEHGRCSQGNEGAHLGDLAGGQIDLGRDNLKICRISRNG